MFSLNFCPRTYEFENHCYTNAAGMLMEFYFWWWELDFMTLNMNRFASSKRIVQQSNSEFQLTSCFFFLIYIKIVTLREIEGVYSLHRYPPIGELRLFPRNFKIKSFNDPKSRQSESGKFRARFGLIRNPDDLRKVSITHRNFLLYISFVFFFKRLLLSYKSSLCLLFWHLSLLMPHLMPILSHW